MTVAELEGLLAADECPQRTKLERVRVLVTAIRALPDDDYARAVRVIKKRIGSPKLATEVADLLREIAGGRVTKPVDAGHAEPDPVPWVGTTPEEADLEAAIAAAPDVRGPYTVLGDYWSSIGDPRGELVAIGHALAKNPTHKAMLAASVAWHERHHRTLWGERAAMVSRQVRNIEWYMGFIRKCLVESADVLAAVVDDQAPGRFIQHLIIPRDTAAAAQVLARRPRPTLRSLMMGETWGALGDISPMWPAIAYVRDMKLSGMSATLGDVQAPRLRQLVFDFGGVEDGVQAIDIFDPLWRASGVPELRQLAILSCDRTDEICEALARSQLAPQLVEIDLAQGTMSDAGAAALLAARERFANVQRWDFSLNYLSDAACAALTALGGEQVIEDQREDDGDRHAANYE